MALDSVLSTPVIPPPPKAATSPTGGSSSSGSGSNSSSSSSSSTSSASSSGATATAASDSSSEATRSKGNNPSRGANSNATRQGQNASTVSNKALQNSAANQAQGAAAANANAAGNAATQNQDQGPSFIQALAQTQADAQESATATVAAAPQEFTGSKPKGAKDDHKDTAGAALEFLPQSLAAAMASLQPASPGQNASPRATSDNDSTDAVSLDGGGGGATTIQSVVANVAQDTAEELKAATPDVNGKAAPSPAPATDNTAATVANAFQAHMVSKAPLPESTDKISTPVGNAGFADEVGDKITWMANQGMQSASLQMTPEHLGPVEVRISMQQNGTASVSFTAAHADTRTALEQALPQLREMFSTQGLTLTDASVSQQSPRGQPQRQPISAIGAIGGAASGDDSTSSSIASVTRLPLGLVDTYA